MLPVKSLCWSLPTDVLNRFDPTSILCVCGLNVASKTSNVGDFAGNTLKSFIPIAWNASYSLCLFLFLPLFDKAILFIPCLLFSTKPSALVIPLMAGFLPLSLPFDTPLHPLLLSLSTTFLPFLPKNLPLKRVGEGTKLQGVGVGQKD